MHDDFLKYPCKQNEKFNDADTIATVETNDDSFFGSVASDVWDLSWYEHFRVFESKQIKRKTSSSDEIDESCREIMEDIDEDEELSPERSNCVLVSQSIFGQLESLKQQMTEYNTMLEVYEETLMKNKRLKKKLQLMRSGRDELRSKHEYKVKSQAERFKRINAQMSNAETELEEMRNKSKISERNEDKAKIQLAKCMVELKLQRQLNYYEEQDAARSDVLERALRNDSCLSDSILPSSPRETNNDKKIWRAMSKAASQMDLNDENLSTCDNSSVNRQVKKNALKMFIKNLQQEGDSELNGNKTKRNSSSVGTPVSSIKSRRNQRKYSNCSNTSTEWDTISELTDPDMRPWKQNSLKNFFASCLTTLQDEEEI